MTDNTEKPAQLIDNPTPFSDRMNWPLLSSNQREIELKTDEPTPFSSQMKWPLLSARKSNVELMTSTPTPFSAMMKWPLLSDKATMFDTDISSARTEQGGESAFNKFIRGIVSGEPQK